MLKPLTMKFKWGWKCGNNSLHGNKQRIVIRLSPCKSVTCSGRPKVKPFKIAQGHIQSPLSMSSITSTIRPCRFCFPCWKMRKGTWVCPVLKVCTRGSIWGTTISLFMSSKNCIIISKQEPRTCIIIYWFLQIPPQILPNNKTSWSIYANNMNLLLLNYKRQMNMLSRYKNINWIHMISTKTP